jgi:hypothetical protein
VQRKDRARLDGAGASGRRFNGQPEHINLGWDTRLDPNGHNEDLTLAQADLWMQTLDGKPEQMRRSIRQLIAMTQGIIRTSRTDSAIADGSSFGHFTPADVAAMQRMSGCGDPHTGPA